MTSSPETGLTLILGPANSGKLGRLLEWWQTRLDARPLIVVPTGPDARSLSTEMAQRIGALVGQSPAVTLDGLVRLLLGRSPRYAGDLERSLLISHLLHESPPRAPGFSVRFPGTISAAGSLLEQLGDSGLPAEEVERVLRRWGATDRTASLLSGDIRALLSGYRLLRDRMGLTDRSDAVLEALAAAERWERPIALYGFTSFTPAQTLLIEALADRSEVLLVFDYERSRTRSLTTPQELGRWEAMAGHVEDLEASALSYNSPAIAHLERHFMDDGPRLEPPPALTDRGGVRFLLASGQRNEAELAAQHITDLIRAGMAPGSIAVVVRHMTTWGRLLKEVLASCGIPCEVDERVTVDGTGLGQAFMAGLRGVVDNDPDGVLEYLRSPFSDVPAEQVSDLQADYLRQTARGPRALRDCAHGVARAALEELLGVFTQRDGGTLIDLGTAMSLARRMFASALRSSAGTTGSGELLADARAFRVLLRSLSDLAAHRTSGALPEGALRPGVLLAALARTTVPAGGLGSEDVVQVLTAHRARARRFEAVLVLGLVEGEFPGRSEKPTLLSPAQRERLDLVAGGLFAPEADEEEALFVRAVSRAWTFLFLSSRDADDGGGYAGPSYYWSHCKDLLGVGEREHAHRTLADQVFDMEGAPTPRQYLRACVASSLHPHPACGLGAPSSRGWSLGRTAGRLTSTRARDELAATRAFSPSALESYLTCPFIWFVERVIGAEDLEVALDRQYVGQLLHKVLSEAYQELSVVDLLPLEASTLAPAQSMVGSIVERLVDGDGCPGTVAERRLAEHQLKRMAANLFAMEIAAGSRRSLVGTELWVGGREGVDVGGVAVRGRIDRVDSTADGGLFVIDYKSGKVPEKRAIGTADGLQVPLYMLALAAERPEQRVVGGAYVSPTRMERAGVAVADCAGIQGPEVRACRVVPAAEMLELLQAAAALAREAAEGIRSGVIAPRADRNCPEWCRISSVCRARRGGGGRRR